MFAADRKFQIGAGLTSACGANFKQFADAFDIQPVLDVHCVQCHLYESQQGGLMLEQGEAHAELVDAPSTQAPMPRVVPGDPDASYLMHKLRGTHLQAGGSGLRMPFGGEAGGSTLGAAQIELIADWIRAGAPDN